MKQQLLFLVLAITIANVSSHAYLAKPASRASAWRIFPGQFPIVKQVSILSYQNVQILNETNSFY